MWDRAGRGYALDRTLGEQVKRTIMDNPTDPQIAWLLYRGWMWSPSQGWTVYDPPEDGSNPGHHNHIHVTCAFS